MKHDREERVALKPCPTPWCDRWTPPYVFERCKDILGVCCPCCSVSTPYMPTEEAAITCWNDRIEPSPDGWKGIEQRARIIVEQFEKDEAQGFRSATRTYVLEMLKPVLPAPPNLTKTGDHNG